jgi:predicted DNA-binding transcriptional regulator YafY
MKRSARLMAIAEHLRGRKTGVTAEALAQRFHVSVRTMYRDLETLQEAALPLRAERGRGGGYALDRAYFLPPVAFSAREAALLVTLAEHALAMRLVPFADTTQTALDKLRAALSSSSQRELLDHMQTLHFTGVPALGTTESIRRVIERAFFERATVDLEYDGARGARRRRVRLRNVLMEGSITFLNITDVDDGAERQLRLDRLRGARIVEGPTSGGPIR